MNNENREKVLNYLKSVESIAPLYFLQLKDIDIFTGISDTYELIKKVLQVSRLDKSINSETHEYETGCDCWRSSLDIWRHIIYYKSKVTIFDVMHELYKWYHVKDGLKGQFCDDILRRTFKDGFVSNQYNSTNHMSHQYIYQKCGIHFDEYGLDWEDWKDI